MKIVFVEPVERAGKERLVSEVELHFEKNEPLAGLKLSGFGLWREKGGNGMYVTLPGRSFYDENNTRRYYVYLRSARDWHKDTNVLTDEIISTWNKENEKGNS